MYEDTRRKALKKAITDARTPRTALEIARARLFELQEQVEAEAAEAADAGDMSKHSDLMAQRDGVGRAWELLDDLVHEAGE